MTEKTLVVYNSSFIETIEKSNGKKKSSYKEEVHYLQISGDINSHKIEYARCKGEWKLLHFGMVYDTPSKTLLSDALTKIINDYGSQGYFVSPNQVLLFLSRQTDKLLLISYSGESIEKELISKKDIELQDLGFENRRLHSELQRESEKVLKYESKIDNLESEIRSLTRELDEQKRKK